MLYLFLQRGFPFATVKLSQDGGIAELLRIITQQNQSGFNTDKSEMPDERNGILQGCVHILKGKRLLVYYR